jgi:xanthine/uracil permease
LVIPLAVTGAVVATVGTRLPQMATNSLFITQEPTSTNFLWPQNTNQEVFGYLATFPHFRPS